MRYNTSLLRFFFLFLLAPSSAFAGSFEVAPTTLILPANSRAGVIHVANRGNNAVFAQIQSLDWSQANMKDEFTPSRTLQISPPMVRLEPGQQQTIRVVASADNANKPERAYRLSVSELPDPAAKKEGIHVLLQFLVPVFVVTAENFAPKVAWKAEEAPEGILLTATNVGERHLKLTELSLSADGLEIASKKKGFDYILSGASRQWSIPARKKPSHGTKISIQAHDEAYGTLKGFYAFGK